MLNIFTAALARGDSISIRGFGKFYLIKQRKKKIRQPSTGQLILRRQKRIVRFKHFKSLRKEINGFEFHLEEFERQNKIILRQLFDLIENIAPPAWRLTQKAFEEAKTLKADLS